MLIARIKSDYIAARKFKSEDAQETATNAVRKTLLSTLVGEIDMIGKNATAVELAEHIKVGGKWVLGYTVNDPSPDAERSMIKAEISKPRETTDEEALDKVTKFAKSLRSNIEVFAKAQKLEDAKKAALELEILSAYLPKQMSDEAVQDIIMDALASGAAERNIGSVMKFLKANYDGLYDSKKTSGLINDILKS
jgi:hypothetical protein